MITKELLLAAYKNGVVRLIKDPNGAGTVCAIGDFWFYFGGMTAEEYEPEEFIRNIPEETIIQEISETLNWFSTELPVEYFYYREFLKEWSERFDAEYRKDENRCSIKEVRGGSICDLQSFSDEDLLSEISRRRIPMHCILEKSGYLAWKLWCREDIKCVLESEGYSVTDDNVDEVINTGALSNLEDCTEGEWEIIFEAIRMCSSYLERRQTDD